MAEHSLVIQGVRSKDNFLTFEPAALVVTPLVDWRRPGEKDFAGVEFTVETAIYEYRFAITLGGLETLIDMQRSAQQETDEQIKRERKHK